MTEHSTPKVVPAYAGSTVSLDNKMAGGNSQAGDDKDAADTEDWKQAKERAGADVKIAGLWLLLSTLPGRFVEATLNSSG